MRFLWFLWFCCFSRSPSARYISWKYVSIKWNVLRWLTEIFKQSNQQAVTNVDHSAIWCSKLNLEVFCRIFELYERKFSSYIVEFSSYIVRFNDQDIMKKYPKSFEIITSNTIFVLMKMILTIRIGTESKYKVTSVFIFADIIWFLSKAVMVIFLYHTENISYLPCFYL